MSIILQQVLAAMEIYQATYPEDACIVVADTEKVIGYLPGKTIDLKIPVGAPVEKFKGTVTERALALGVRMQEERSSEGFGLAYISTSTPIYEDGKLVGAIGAIVSNKKLDLLRTGAAELSAVVEELVAAKDQISSASQDVSSRVSELTSESSSMIDDIKTISSVLTIVREIAEQSQMLSLNASIEAARAGEHGLGFAVVASEIRKMADTSKKSAAEIKEKLQHLQRAVERMNGSIQQIAAFTEEHNGSLQEFTSSFGQIAQISERLQSSSTIKE